jgi:hypothetical protein
MGVEVRPLLTWPDRLMGTQYLFDVIPTPAASGPAPAPVAHLRVVDDARYQLHTEDDSAGAGAARTLTFIMALYNRGAHLRAWAAAMAEVAVVAAAAAGPVQLCVADYGSDDVDVGAVLATVGVPVQLLRLPGSFAKTAGLNACLAALPGPPTDHLVFTTVRPLSLSLSMCRHACEG